MTKEFIPYEQALELKELGFDEPCFSVYYNGEYHEHGIQNQFLHEKNECSAPTFSQCFRWFREKYGLEGVTQRAEYFMWYKWIIHQYTENVKKYVDDWFEYKTYEKAELECLIKLIEIVKNK